MGPIVVADVGPPPDETTRSGGAGAGIGGTPRFPGTSLEEAMTRRRTILEASLVRFALPALVLLLGLPPRDLRAQAVSGTILGDVTDTSGAVVPGATVTLVNTGTGFTRSVVTDAN